MTAIKKAGFDKVTEVAEGADITTANEARELVERLENGARFMTTSCCAAWIQAVKKHLPALKEFVSHTKTPAAYTAEIEKKNGFVTVFVGPCVSKRVEGMEDPNIDFVMTYEELGAMLEAKGINPAECEEMPQDPTGGTLPSPAAWPRRWKTPSRANARLRKWPSTAWIKRR
jgi:iron only hydrogenase large subunit-like protein